MSSDVIELMEIHKEYGALYTGVAVKTEPTKETLVEGVVGRL